MKTVCYSPLANVAVVGVVKKLLSGGSECLFRLVRRKGRDKRPLVVGNHVVSAVHGAILLEIESSPLSEEVLFVVFLYSLRCRPT